MTELSIDGCAVEIIRDRCCTGSNIYDTVLNWYPGSSLDRRVNANRWRIWVTGGKDGKLAPWFKRRAVVGQIYETPVPDDEGVLEYLRTEVGLELSEWGEVRVLISHSERWGILVHARLPDTVLKVNRRLELLTA